MTPALSTDRGAATIRAMPARRQRTVDPEAKREAILEAAERLFAERGYSATSTAAIAAEAGVATGTVFTHFADKATLLSALHKRIEVRFVDAMSAAWEASDAPAPERFEPMFHALFRVAAEQRDILPVLALAVAGPGSDAPPPGALMRERIAAQYAGAVERGELRALPVRAVTEIVHGMVEGAMRHWMMHPVPRRRNEAIATLVTLTRAALEP